jgi:hypothetical protein
MKNLLIFILLLTQVWTDYEKISLSSDNDTMLQYEQRLIYTESSFRNKVISPAYAYGRYQITKEVLSDYNIFSKGPKYKLPDLFCPEKARNVYYWHIFRLLKLDWPDMTREGKIVYTFNSYNMGRGNSIYEKKFNSFYLQKICPDEWEAFHPLYIWRKGKKIWTMIKKREESLDKGKV